MSAASSAVHLSFCLVLACCAGLAAAQASSPAKELLARRSSLSPQTLMAGFGAPLHLLSKEGDNRLQGDVYAELAQPFAKVSAVLRSADSVCEVLFLHLNMRSCKVSVGVAGPQLTLEAGPKRAAAGATYRAVYAMQVGASSDDYLHVALSADSGPLSTSDYRFVFEATPLDDKRTFLHFAYAYRYGAVAKVAMGLYLATAGRSKIGFTSLGRGPDGEAQFVQGERGSLERNVVRNYLALQAHTGAGSGTSQALTEIRMRAWFALTEQHAPQLHELDLSEYLQEKHDDLVRAAAPAP
jgi:hypothetical protein